MRELIERLQAMLGDVYTIERELDGGGMARVFLAKERALGRRVVIKTLPTELAETVSAERFRREVQVAATLQHPHIVPVLAAGEKDGVLYYVMPFVDGESLRAWLGEHPRPSIRQAIHILRDVGAALAFAHRHGVVHRDIKPENILISGDSALVTDFGIAKALSTSTDEDTAQSGPVTLTAAGVVIGSPAYMSPEQVLSSPRMDGRSDLYSLGCVAFELLTGHPPFSGGRAQQVLASQVTARPPSVDRLRPDTPPQLAALVARCLDKAPEGRPGTAQDVVDELDEMQTAGAPTHSARRILPWAAVVALTAVGAFAAMQLIAERDRTVGHRAPVPPGIAILPLRSVGGDTANRWFADGTTEELATELHKLVGMRVLAPASASVAVARVGRDPQAVGHLLGVDWLLDGSIRRAGADLRLTLRLVSTVDGSMAWSEEYTRSISSTADLFEIQSEVAHAVAGALRLSLRERASAAHGMVSLEAHDLYLQGRASAGRFTEPDLRRAIQLYDSALAREPQYALAWAAKSEAWSYLADSWLAPRVAYPRAKDAARRALTIDPMLAEAHAMLADVLAIYDWNPRAAEIEATRALALDPRSGSVLTTVVFQLMAAGRLDSAVVLLDRSEPLDPFNTVIRFWRATTLLAAHHIAEGCAEARHAFEIAPSGMAENWGMGECLIQRGRANDALPHLRQAAGYSPQMQALYARGLALSGRTAEARVLVDSLERMSRRRYVSGTALASAYAALGDTGAAFASLERAVRDRGAELAIVPLRTMVSSLRSDRRFEELLRRMRPL